MTDPTKQPPEQRNLPPEPPVLIPPDAHVKTKSDSFFARNVILLVISLVLVSAALVVVFWSPRPVADVSGPPSVETSARLADKAPVLAPGEKLRADQAGVVNGLLVAWAGLQARAEAERIAQWGGESYAQASAMAEECNRQLTEEHFPVAEESCRVAIDSLESLLNNKAALFDNAISAGSTALENGDTATAEAHFRQALAISPESEDAAQGLQRAKRLPEVMALVDAGLANETAGDLYAAQQSLRQAIKMDTDYLPAHTALDRVNAAIAVGEFQLAMTRALDAMNAGRLTAAEAALKQAGQYKPGDPVIQDVRQQIDRIRRANQLTELRRAAEQAEAEERWQDAGKACEKALGIDPQAAFAVACRERVNQRIALSLEMQSILTRPERLFEAGPLEQARQLQARAAAVSPHGPLLSSQLARMDQLIREAEAEVEVLIRSDGLTDVVIYHVGRLGRFQEKRLILRAGNYQVTGSRNGFRDVRQTLEVRSGSAMLVFNVRCEEAI